MAIKPFRELFVEPHLQGAISLVSLDQALIITPEAVTHLLQTVEGISLDSMSPSIIHDDSMQVIALKPASSLCSHQASRQHSLSSSTPDSVIEEKEPSRSPEGMLPSNSITKLTTSTTYNPEMKGGLGEIIRYGLIRSHNEFRAGNGGSIDSFTWGKTQ